MKRSDHKGTKKAHMSVPNFPLRAAIKESKAESIKTKNPDNLPPCASVDPQDPDPELHEPGQPMPVQPVHFSIRRELDEGERGLRLLLKAPGLQREELH